MISNWFSLIRFCQYESVNQGYYVELRPIAVLNAVEMNESLKIY